MNYKIREIKTMVLREIQVDNPLMDTPEKVSEFLLNNVVNSPKYSADIENFIVLFVNNRTRISAFEIICNGILDTILVHPREVFKAAIINNAKAIIIAHNHPSGDVTPSEADIKMTRDLIRAGQLLKIEVLDHIILGEKTENHKGYSSLRELGYFY